MNWKSLCLQIFLATILGAILFPVSVQAQGTFSCFWSPASEICRYNTNNCDTNAGYVPYVDCTTIGNKTTCETYANPASCVLPPAPSSRCCPNAGGCTYKGEYGTCSCGTDNTRVPWVCASNETCNTQNTLTILTDDVCEKKILDPPNACAPAGNRPTYSLYWCGNNGQRQDDVVRACCTVKPSDNACVNFGHCANDKKVVPNACRPDEHYIYEYKNNRCEAVPFPVTIPCADGTPFCFTSVGRVDTSPSGLFNFLLPYVLMIAGLIILIGLLTAGYLILTSSGNPEKVQASKEMVTSLFAGIVMVLLSFLLLRAIGIDILGLPGLKFNP